MIIDELLRTARLGSLIAASIALVACKVGPNYHKPDAPVPVAYKELPPGAPVWKPSTPQDGKDRGIWWSIYNDPELDTLELPDTLSAAIRDLRRLPSHGAQVRQRQYIGKLMRKIDAEPLRAKLAERKRRHVIVAVGVVDLAV